MNQKNIFDEYLEQLWCMREAGQSSMNVFKRTLAVSFDPDIMERLSLQGLIENAYEQDVSLTRAGEVRARQVIRAHRLAERFLHDVFGGDFEKGACEFEHTVNLELVDGICTLLGHPVECPHGLPIPPGECCKRSDKTALNCVLPLDQLKVGTQARIAYVKSDNDQQLHQLESLCVRPGVMLKLHQNYPTYVIECEGAQIALDKDIAANISVWKSQQ